FFLLSMSSPSLISPLFPYTTLFRSQHSFIPWQHAGSIEAKEKQDGINYRELAKQGYCTITSHPQGLINEEQVYHWLLNYIHDNEDRKSTRLNSSHVSISYAVFCLKK